MAMLTELAPQSKDGGYLRPAPQLGGGVTARGWPANLPMETGRYHVCEYSPFWSRRHRPAHTSLTRLRLHSRRSQT